LTQELKSKEKRKGSAKRGLKKKRGKQGETLGKPYPRERKRDERDKEAQERHQKTSRWTRVGKTVPLRVEGCDKKKHAKAEIAREKIRRR